MKKILVLVLALVMLILPTGSLALDFGSLGDALGSLFGAEETKIEIDPADIPDGVSPEFYEKMVTLEVFFDEYIAFMDKYSKSDNASEMMTDYLSFMTKYTDAMNDLDSIDEKKLSKEEDDFYTETLLRINTKLSGYTLTLD